MDFAVQAGKLVAPPTAAGATSEARRAGTLMGMPVAEVHAPVSPLVDAATEMGLMAGETAADEMSLKDFEQDRKVDDERRERILKYKEMMHKDQGKIHRLEALQDFLDSRHERRDNKREISRFFSNPTDLYVALGYILSTLEAPPPGTTETTTQATARTSQASEVRWLMDDLEESHGPRIRADFVGAVQGSTYPDLGEGTGLGGFYGGVVCDFSTVNEVLAHIHARFGPDGFDRAMDFLFGALGADMASHQPSMEMTHLEQVQGSLGQVRLMQNAYLHCETLLARWEQVHGVQDCRLKPLDLAGQLVDLRQNTYLGGMHIEAIAAQAQAPDVEREVLFLQEMLTMIRSLPPRLFDGDEGRMKVLDATQQAVDRAVEREDAWIAAHQSGVP